MKQNYLIFLLLIFGTFLQADDNKPAKTILCLGDSLTAGYGVKEEFSYPSLLQNSLGKDYTIINAGVSGNTSAGGLRRVNWYFNRKIDILILALGANDGLRGLPVEKTTENLQEIINFAKEKNPEIVILLAGMKVPPNMGAEYSEKFEKIFPDLAEKNKIFLIPFLLEGVAGFPEFNLPDGIHPNEKGQAKVADNILKILSEKLKITPKAAE